MAIRNDLSLSIDPASFHDFDNGKKVIKRVPASWKLKTEDLIVWTCAHFSGLARVINCGDEGDKLVCTFQKFS